jgi:hypothetical protein
MTPEQIEKLPKWAQEGIQNLKRERELAVRKMEALINANQEGSFRVAEFVCTTTPPAMYETFIQGTRLDINWKGIEVNIILRDESIDFSYGCERHRMGRVNLTPCSFQQFRLEPITTTP